MTGSIYEPTTVVVCAVLQIVHNTVGVVRNMRFGMGYGELFFERNLLEVGGPFTNIYNVDQSSSKDYCASS